MYTLPKDKRSYKYYYGVEDLGAENSEKEMYVCRNTLIRNKNCQVPTHIAI